MTQGAVMAFEADHGLTTDGIPGPIVWHTLICGGAPQRDARSPTATCSSTGACRRTLTLWNDGQTILHRRR